MYVQNRSPHQALDFKTPEDIFTSKKPNVSHFIIFGYLVYFHVSEEKDQRDVELSHDVTFDEDTTLGKAKYLPIPRKDNDDVAGKAG